MGELRQGCRAVKLGIEPFGRPLDHVSPLAATPEATASKMWNSCPVEAFFISRPCDVCFYLPFLVASMLNSPRFASCVLSVCSPFLLMGVAGAQFGAQQVITNVADAAKSVYAADLDGDGDADVLSASQLDGKIAWHETLGGGAFGVQQVITTTAGGALSVHATDLDEDGDADVLSASAWHDKITWYENLGGGALGVEQVITTATA